jgi:hypothetical protein
MHGRAGGRRREEKRRGEGKRKRGKKKKRKKKRRRKKKGKKKEKKGRKIKKREGKIGERILEKIRKIVREIWEGVLRGFSRFSGRRHILRDGGDGEGGPSIGTAACAGFPAGGRPRRWEGAQGCGRGAVPAEFAARAPGRERGKQLLGFEW